MGKKIKVYKREDGSYIIKGHFILAKCIMDASVYWSIPNRVDKYIFQEVKKENTFKYDDEESFKKFMDYLKVAIFYENLRTSEEKLKKTLIDEIEMP